MSVEQSAADIVALVRQLVEEAVAQVQPYRAVVTGLSGGRVFIRAVDEETADGMSYAREGGLKVAEGDEVIVQRVSGEPVIRGILQSDVAGVRSIDGGIDASDVVQGELPGSRIAPLSADQIQSGKFSTSRIPDLAAGIVTAGQFDGARIPDLPADKIASGTLSTSRIPNLAAGIITSGVFDRARVPDIAVKEGTTTRVADLISLRFNSTQFDVADNGGGEAEVTIENVPVVVKEGATTVVSNVKSIRFNSVQFNVVDNGGGEAEITLA